MAARDTHDGRPSLRWGDEGAVAGGPQGPSLFLLPAPATALAALAAWSAMTWLGNALP